MHEFQPRLYLKERRLVLGVCLWHERGYFLEFFAGYGCFLAGGQQYAVHRAELRVVGFQHRCEFRFQLVGGRVFVRAQAVVGCLYGFLAAAVDGVHVLQVGLVLRFCRIAYLYGVVYHAVVGACSAVALVEPLVEHAYVVVPQPGAECIHALYGSHHALHVVPCGGAHYHLHFGFLGARLIEFLHAAENYAAVGAGVHLGSAELRLHPFHELPCRRVTVQRGVLRGFLADGVEVVGVCDAHQHLVDAGTYPRQVVVEHHRRVASLADIGEGAHGAYAVHVVYAVAYPEEFLVHALHDEHFFCRGHLPGRGGTLGNGLAVYRLTLFRGVIHFVHVFPP